MFNANCSAQVLHLVTSDDATEDVPREDKYKCVIYLIALKVGEVIETIFGYDVNYHVFSDIAIKKKTLLQSISGFSTCLQCFTVHK